MTKKIKVAFQGEKGAYSHLASLEVFPKAEVVGCSTFEEAFQLAKDNSEYKICNDYNNVEDDNCSNSCAPIHCTSTSDHLYYLNVTIGNDDGMSC